MVFICLLGGSLNATLDLSNYGFLFGTFPTAPSVFVYAAHYSIANEVVCDQYLNMLSVKINILKLVSGM